METVETTIWLGVIIITILGLAIASYQALSTIIAFGG